jgi:Spy/CpxP family protein refolding chaperone
MVRNIWPSKTKNKQMKKSWIIIIIIFLLASNLALLATLILSRDTCDTRIELSKNNGPGPMPNNKKNAGSPFEDYLARDLNMTPGQVQQLKSFSAEFHQSKRDLIKKMGNVKREYFTHLAIDKPDETYLKNLADSLGRLLADKMLLEFNHYNNIKSVCTPEQAKKLDSLSKNHIHHRDRLDFKRRH